MTDFFIVGHPKSGTTTLYSLLKVHPDIFLPDFKEPKFFCTDIHWESDEFHGIHMHFPIREISDYLSLYKSNRGKCSGEVSPNYLFSGEAAKNIYNFNPDAKIIILLREPVSFLQSLHYEQIFQMTEDEPDFIEALHLEEERRKGNKVPKYIQAPKYTYYSDWVKYKNQIQRYMKYFPPSKIKIIIFEDLIQNELRTCYEILGFLGISLDNYEAPKIVNRNPGKTLRFKFIRRFSKIPLIRKMAYQLIPIKYYGSVDQALKSLLITKKSMKPKLKKNDIEQLMNVMLPEVISISNFLVENGLYDKKLIDLWGYRGMV